MHVPPEVIDAFRDHRAVVFAGAGISVAAGMPSWTDLVKPLKAEIEDLPEGDISPIDIAQFYVNEHHRLRLASSLSRILDTDNVAPTQVHRKLVKLPISRIYTTNFDNLLEKACAEERIKYQVITNAGQLANARTDRLNIIKLHGDLNDPESLVITAEHFEDYFVSHRAVASRIASELRDSTLLFIGYSFTDPDLRTIVRTVREDAAGFGRNHFIVLPAAKKPILIELDRRGLKPICLEVNGNKTLAVLNWISELEREIEKSSTPPSSPARPLLTHNLPSAATDLFGRDADVTRILELLSSQQTVTIIGAPGIGKTTLAVNVAHSCSKTPPLEGLRHIVWVTGRHKPTQQCWLNDVLNLVGTQLGYPVITQKPAEAIDDKMMLVDFLLTNHHTLLVLDNLDTMADPALVDWLRTIPPACKLLVTARHSELPMGSEYELKGLPEPEAIQFLRRYAHSAQTAELLRRDPQVAGNLVAVTCGNPQAMKLAFGYLSEEGTRLQDVISGLDPIRSNVDDVFDKLFDWCWEKLSYDAERLLLTMALFPETSRVRVEALREASGFTAQTFDQALEQVLRFGLIEASAQGEDNYVLHSKTRSFALQQLETRSKFAEQARDRCARYYLEFVRSIVVRPKPEVPYWNALVTEKMKAIDTAEWPMIRELMDWCGTANRGALLVDFVMLLVHYLDSRFLNRERLKYVGAAIEVLSRTNRLAEEALLRIDSLGWTYVEESNWPEAHKQIDAGHQLARRLEAQERLDLTALANAWKARALVEEGNRNETAAHIATALQDVSRCNPWIRMRVYMAAGDIALKEHRSEDAYRYYQNAKEAADSYGGEGGGYQLDPRLGLALIDLDRFDEAQAKFQSVRDLENIPIGNLYGEYGLALVAYKRGRVNEANGIIKRVRQQIEQNATSNLLWTLLNELYKKLHGGEAQEQNVGA